VFSAALCWRGWNCSDCLTINHTTIISAQHFVVCKKSEINNHICEYRLSNSVANTLSFFKTPLDGEFDVKSPRKRVQHPVTRAQRGTAELQDGKTGLINASV